MVLFGVIFIPKQNHKVKAYALDNSWGKIRRTAVVYY